MTANSIYPLPQVQTDRWIDGRTDELTGTREKEEAAARGSPKSLAYTTVTRHDIDDIDVGSAAESSL
jgi:hypothetical protein